MNHEQIDISNEERRIWLAEMNVNASECEGCLALVPQDDLQTVTAYGVEGSFCHACRHGKDCKCQE